MRSLYLPGLLFTVGAALAANNVRYWLFVHG